ncbi:SDR family NAD(P)-dependent oxidoreductase [Sphingomonas pokkalii]|uniref:Short-chain dehydrogenase n=1 Tax=Sphingomonas pokkalii TaxID=2175090 RepID=A0A2U0SB78_9SPHN|nr:SDR family oxidoreductase [Sphingomonas pokkalii]PVX28638.1 short-chain dehydrogenase [Sphingomonas pokkalii]
MKLGIEGKRALVTASSSGIGKAVAQRLSAEGVQIVIHGLDRRSVDQTASAIIGDGGSAERVVGDLSTPEGAAAIVAEVAARGDIDILVNTAFEQGDDAPDWLSTPELGWERCYATNVLSAVRTIRAFVPAMRRKGWGRIINLSGASPFLPSADIPDFQASAAALANLTISLARSLGGTGVTANLISPAPILAVGQRAPSARPSSKEGNRTGRLTRQPDKTEEFSAAAALLASRLADSTTGTNLHIGGDNTHALPTTH